ncbi:NAD(P)-dependent oxidoreductase [Mucilaginibacter jinjuensis]|uniref:SDR family oxidoreductase n=1 Tax=Mucilaginibacter jinjuensis TaxID=1176721 RepID=A0ABY7TCJ5_9SPHI|nr:SDR family oxidoreductase [Mucilaginibacter jinjuensis]WCT13433.1 SDR family oxidoreductase [Mucilaginibacter jinjuensis]
MKKILLFGASGGTGKQFAEQALKAGHSVTAIIRNPDTFAMRHQNLRIIKGDILEPTGLIKAFEESEIVISCLGIPKIQPTTLYSSGMANIINVMEKSGLQRLICISSGALDIPQKSSFIMNFLLKNILQKIYRPIYADMRQMEQNLKDSRLNWTILRAPKLTDGKKTGTYKDITGQALRGIPKISRADLAAYMLAHLSDDSTFKKTIDIAY